MFRGNARYLKFRLEVGQKITISGSITAYVPRGNYQLLCNKIEPSGTGALALAYEQLKTKLQIKGYFDKSIKKQLPKFPKTIYVVTSNTGAAIEDMKKVLTNRYPLAKMILIPALVQGEGSAGSIVRSIEIVDNLAQNSSEHSLIIIGRGGGSIEDLWSFNEEIVADAVFNTKTPIISAVGHESDFVISDFVADIRASTPSNAIEIATPDINELRIYLDNINDEFKNRLLRIISLKEQYLFQLKKSFEQHSLTKRFELIQTNINNLNQQYRNIYAQKINFYQNQIDNIEKSFELNHPSKKTKKGFVQITKDNNIISLKEIAKDEMLQLHDTNYMVDCKVLSKIEIK
jgi:exodeoxyribonuclease VII large subunit